MVEICSRKDAADQAGHQLRRLNISKSLCLRPDISTIAQILGVSGWTLCDSQGWIATSLAGARSSQ
jgi:hypothetical protein